MVCHHRFGLLAATLAGIAFVQSLKIGRTRLDRSANIQLATAASLFFTCCTSNRRRPKWKEQNESMPYRMSVLKMIALGAISSKRTGFSGSLRSERFLKRILCARFRIRGISLLSCLTHFVCRPSVFASASWPIRRSDFGVRYASDDGKNLHLALVLRDSSSKIRSPVVVAVC